MDSVLGIQYEGGVIIAADQMNASYGVLILQENIDKVPIISSSSSDSGKSSSGMNNSSHTMMGVCGPNCDVTNFTNAIQQHIRTVQYQNNSTMSLPVSAQANYTRSVISTALRRGPYQVDLLFGGVDGKTKQSSLYWMDYLGTMQKVEYGCQGYCTQFCLSIMDEQYNTNIKMTRDDAIRIVQMCIVEIQKRFLPQQPQFIVKCIEYDTALNDVTTQTISFGKDPADY